MWAHVRVFLETSRINSGACCWCWGCASSRANETSVLLLLSRFSCVRLCVTPETAAHQAPCPWDSPGKNTGVACHFLLQCMEVKSESEVAQSCPTLSDPVGWSLPGSSVHGIFQAGVLEWGAIAFSEQSMIWPQMSAVSRPRKSGLTDQDFKNASIILLPRPTKLRTVLLCHHVLFQLKK